MRDAQTLAMELLSVVYLSLVESLADVLWSDRLENEHVGNKDQYRVTREVPLPYNINRYVEEEEEDDADEEEENNRPGWMRMPLLYH
jgi:hypothetical protein